MTDKFAFIFPGQGEQYPTMGKDFFKSFKIAKELFEEAEECLNRKITEIMFNGTMEELTKTVNCQVAVYIHSIAILEVIKQQFPSLHPCVNAGLSLGEYSALCSSSVVSFIDGLTLLQKRADFLNQACEQTKGSMAAVIGLSGEIIEETILSLRNKGNKIWVANYNSPTQTVISGTKEGIDIASDVLKQKGAKRVLPLQVAGAFHSGLMMAAQEKLGPTIRSENFQKPKDSSIVMNVTGDYAEDVNEIKDNLISQVTHSVRWDKSIRSIENRDNNPLYIEIGCGTVLSGLNKRINIQKQTLSIGKVEDLEKLENL